MDKHGRVWRSVLLVLALEFRSASLIQADVVTFDLDTGAPTLTPGQGLPLDQTSGGVTAHFTGRFSIQSDATTYFSLSQFSGNYLYPNDVYSPPLDIQFSQQLTDITFTFATADFQQVEVPTTIQLTAYVDSTANPPIGSATAHGAYGSDTMPMGTLSFISAQPFNLVEITIPPASQAASDFLADNVIVTTAGPVSTTTTTSSTTTTTLPPAPGDLKCYKVKDSRAKATYTLDLISGVGGLPNALGCTVKGSSRICVEVDGQNVNPPPPGGGPVIPQNTGSAFLSYKVKCPKQTVAPVTLRDQLGAGLFTVGAPAELLVPALPGPANDHFECYKAKDARAKAAYTMNLLAGVAGFTDEIGCTLKLGAKRVCVQVTAQNVAPPPPGGGPAPGSGSGAMFISYKLKCPKGVLPPASFADQFGPGTFTPGTAAALLMPAS